MDQGVKLNILRKQNPQYFSLYMDLTGYCDELLRLLVLIKFPFSPFLFFLLVTLQSCTSLKDLQPHPTIGFVGVLRVNVC